MKVAVIISEGVKQVMLTPENENEKFALRMISPDDNIELAVKQGSLLAAYGDIPAGYNVNMCRGGYLRTWTDENSIMLVLTPKKPEAAEEKL